MLSTDDVFRPQCSADNFLDGEAALKSTRTEAALLAADPDLPMIFHGF